MITRDSHIRKTISILSNGVDISDNVLNIAYSKALDSRRDSSFNCPVFGSGLHFGATSALLDTMYRFFQDEHRLAEVLTGRFSQIVAQMAIASAMRKGYSAKKSKSKLKTSFSVQRNLLAEIDSIKSIANGILFSSERNRHLVIPMSVKKINRPNELYDNKVFAELTCRRFLGEDIKFFLFTDRQVFDNISKICIFNTEQNSPEDLEWIIVPTTENEKYSQISNAWQHTVSRAGSIRCVNPIISSFYAAAHNWVQLELGIGGVNTTYLEDELNNPRNSIPAKEVMVPDLSLGLIVPKTKIQTRILNHIKSNPDAFSSAIDVYNSMPNPPSKNAFYDNFAALARIGQKAIMD